MREQNKSSLSVVLAFMSYAIFGFSFLFSKRALMVSSPFELLAVRFTVAFLILNLLLLTGKFKLRFKGKPVLLLLLLGFIQPVLYFIFENVGVKLLSTSFVGIIISLVPITSMLFSFLLLHEKVRPFQIACSVLSVFGVAMTTIGQSAGDSSFLGFLAIIGAVAAASLYNVLTRRISQDFSSFERTYAMFALGTIVFVPVALIQNGANPDVLIEPLLSGDFWVSILFLAGLSSVAAFLMLNYAMTHISVAKTSIFANITTIISILAGVVLLHERFGIYQMIGSIVIIACVYGVNKPIELKKQALQTDD